MKKSMKKRQSKNPKTQELQLMKMEPNGMRMKLEFGGLDIQDKTTGLNMRNDFAIPLNESR